MTLYDELYFEINLIGPKSEIKKFVRYLQSGELDDFFEFSSDYVNYDDDFADAGDDEETADLLPVEDEKLLDEVFEEFCRVLEEDELAEEAMSLEPDAK